MSLFSDKENTVVGSSVWNLAGDVDGRVQYLSTTLLSTVFRSSNQPNIFLGDTIAKSYLSGPGIRQRRAFNWAKDNFPLGMPVSSLSGSFSVSTASVDTILSTALGVGANEDLVITGAVGRVLTYSDFAEKWLLANNPDILGTNWSCSYDITTGYLTIYYIDDTTSSFALGVLNQNILGLVIHYYVRNTNSESQTMVYTQEPSIYIYQYGGGNASLDALIPNNGVITGTGLYEFYPFIPIRLNEDRVTEAHTSTAFYESCSKAFKKFMDYSFETFMDEFHDENNDVGDIDFAFIVHGVSLNVRDNAGKKYIYYFLRYLMNNQQYDVTSWNAFEADYAAYDAATTTRSLWDIDPDLDWFLHEEPDVPEMTYPDTNVITWKSPDTSFNNNFHMSLEWYHIEESFHSGVGKVDASRGDCWLEEGTSLTFEIEKALSTTADEPVTYMETVAVPVFYVYHQYGHNAYSKLKVVGLTHYNYVYQGKSIELLSSDCLDTTADETGFIIPLHDPTVREMGLVDSTQLVTADTFVICNAYETVKTKWYERGFFRIILMVIIAAVAAFIFPGAANAMGLLGANAALGASFGLSGIAAVMMGAALNALASAVMMNFISIFSVEMFGDQIGQLVATVVSYIAMSAYASFQATGTYSVDWGSLANANNLLKLTSALPNVYAGYLRGEAVNILAESEEMSEEFEADSEDVKQAASEMGLLDGWIINPLILTDVTNEDTYKETPDEFVSRTLLTGSDIVDISYNMIYEEVDLFLKLPV